MYNDKWYDGVLHYTGIGKVGDQTLTGNQNRTLAESESNGVEVHIFQDDDPGEYTYLGVVKLAGKPYHEIQVDDNGNPRKVWMFPLKKVSELKEVQQKEPEVVVQIVKPEPGTDKKRDVNMITEQSTVFHNRFGTGTVTQIADGKIYVEFDGQQKIFQYPEAFDKGWLVL